MRFRLQKLVSKFGLFLVFSLLLLLFLPLFLFINIRDFQLNGSPIMLSRYDVCAFVSSSLIWFKLISLFACFCSSNNFALLIFRGDNSFVDPPKSLPRLLPIVIIFSLTNFHLLRKELFSAVSRYKIEFSWIFVGGKTTFQL